MSLLPCHPEPREGSRGMVRTVATTETPAGNVILRLSLKACPELAEGMTKIMQTSFANLN